MNLIYDMATYWKPPPSQVMEKAAQTPRKTNRERFSVSHHDITRNPQRLLETPLQDQDFKHMILHPPTQGVVRVFLEPGSCDSSLGDMPVVTHQGVTTLTTSTGQANIDGARWHLMSTIFGKPTGTKARIE